MGTAHDLGSIVVGEDGSANAGEALGRAIELAAASGARVVAVHALGLLAHLRPGDEPVPVESHRQELEKVFHDEWCRPLRHAGVSWSAELVAGDSVGALLSAAEREDAWTVVVGRRGHRPYGAGPLGSTSLQLVLESHRPVLVVPPPVEG